MTADEVAASAASAFAAKASQAIADRGVFHCAVAGGSVAERVLPQLARQPLDWARVHIWLADERLVPADDPESNGRAVRVYWIDRLGPAPAPVLHTVRGVGRPATEVAADAAAELTVFAGNPPRLDLVLLGVGPDGHVASLFPGHTDWRTACEWVIAVDDAPKPPPNRISLGLASLARAREIWFVAFGREKSAAIAEARHAVGSPLPVAVVARSGPAVRWFLDDAASGS